MSPFFYGYPADQLSKNLSANNFYKNSKGQGLPAIEINRNLDTVFRIHCINIQ